MVEQVFGLEISMNDVVTVQVRYGRENGAEMGGEC